MSTETLWLILAIEIVIAVFGVRFVVTMYQKIHHGDDELEDELDYYDDELEFDEKHPAISLLVDLIQISVAAFVFVAFADIIYQLFVAATEPFFGGGHVITADLIGIFPNMF